jgi:hypothetical protein
MEIWREIPLYLKSRKNIGDFTWKPKYFLLLQVKLNRHKTLSSNENVSGY